MYSRSPAATRTEPGAPAKKSQRAVAQSEGHGRAVVRGTFTSLSGRVLIHQQLDGAHAAAADLPAAENIRRDPAQQVGEQQRRGQFVAHGGKRRDGSRSTTILGWPGARHDHRPGIHLADAARRRARPRRPLAFSSLKSLARRPAAAGWSEFQRVERHLLDGLADGNGRALGGRIDPDGIGRGPLRRNEAVQDHQAAVVGAVLLRLAVDGGDARRGGEHGPQQVGLVGIDGDGESGLRRAVPARRGRRRERRRAA